jgi:hypothetical protein
VKTPEDGYIKAETCSVEKNYSTERIIIIIIIAARKTVQKNDQVKEIDMGKLCSTNGEKRIACRILAGSQKERDH